MKLKTWTLFNLYFEAITMHNKNVVNRKLMGVIQSAILCCIAAGCSPGREKESEKSTRRVRGRPWEMIFLYKKKFKWEKKFAEKNEISDEQQ